MIWKFDYYQKTILALYHGILFYRTKNSMCCTYRKSSHLWGYFTVYYLQYVVNYRYISIHYTPGFTRPLKLHYFNIKKFPFLLFVHYAVM